MLVSLSVISHDLCPFSSVGRLFDGLWTNKEAMNELFVSL